MARLVALAHHERWDGHGYPYAWPVKPFHRRPHAMTSAFVFDAPFQQAPLQGASWPEEKRLPSLQSSHKAFDPALVKLFIDPTPELQRFVDCI